MMKLLIFDHKYHFFQVSIYKKMTKCIINIPSFINQWGFELQPHSEYQAFFNNSVLGIFFYIKTVLIKHSLFFY